MDQSVRTPLAKKYPGRTLRKTTEISPTREGAMFQLIDTSPITPETVSQNHCNFWQVLLKIYLISSNLERGSKLRVRTDRIPRVTQ